MTDLEVQAMKRDNAYEQDARRYRWLRSHGDCPFAETDPVWYTPEAFDAAVDENLKAEA